MPYRKHSRKQSGSRIVAQTTDFSGRCHIDSQYGVGLLQAVEGELTGLDTHIIEIEQALVRFLHGQSQHDFRGQFNHIDLKHLAHERETPRSAQVAFNDLDVVVLSQELDIERSADFQLAGYLPGNLLDAAYRLHIQFLCRELDCGISRMHAGKLDVLADGVCHDFSLTCHGIHLHLFGML